MNLRPLGATGLPVTPIGLGLAALGRPAYITLARDRDLGADRSVDAMEARCHDMLDAAYAAGIRYVDAARSYGLAEAFLASWLYAHGARPDRPVIGSKWGYTYAGDWKMDAATHEVKELTVATLRRQLAETRALLGANLRLYQIHSATIESGVLNDGAVLGGLATLKGEGVAVGLTVTGPKQAATVERALDVTVDGVRLFDTVQATWNLLEPSAGPALADAHARGVGVVVKEALANGRLTGRHADPVLAPLREHAAARETTIETLALAAALANPWADVVLSGAVSRDQLLANVSALELRSVVSVRALPPIAEAPATYWNRRKELGWQ